MTEFTLTFPRDVADFVRETYAQADQILEYGSGGSTLLAAELGVRCIAVESDKIWAERLNHSIKQSFAEGDKVKVIHVNIGSTKKWGYPADHRNWARFWNYPLSIWENTSHDLRPDVVLIDGRMRKACFAATLLKATCETIVLFDDYVDREAYHDVEKIVKPSRIVGRMAEFRIEPNMMDAKCFALTIPWFSQLK